MGFFNLKPKNMKSKVVLITGCSTGVGFETAIEFAKAGHKVYATMRNLEKATKLNQLIAEENLSISILQLDVQDNSSIKKTVLKIIEIENRIDILINNAGQGFIKTVEQTSEEEAKNLFDLNFFGNTRTVKAVLPTMRKQKSGHIIGISSVGGLVGQPLNELYCASKFALEGFYESMATYMTKYFGIKISIIEPAGIATEFVNNVMANVIQTGGFADDDYKQVLDDYMETSRKKGSFAAQTPNDIAQVILNCSTLENPPLRIRTSEKAEEFTKLKTNLDPDGTLLCKQITKNMLEYE